MRNCRPFQIFLCQQVPTKMETVEQFKQYMPLLDKSAEKYTQYQDLMLSAVDCLKFTLVFRVFSVWNIILMGIAYGLDQDIIKKTVDKVDTEKLKNRSTKIAKTALPKEVYEKMSNFVELAGSMEKSSANVSTALTSIKTNLTSMLSSPIALAKFMSKHTIKDSAKSLRSCFSIFSRVLTDKELQQDFLDGVIYVRDGVYESSKLVRSVSTSTAKYARTQIGDIITKIGAYNLKEQKLDANEKEDVENLDSMLKRTVENDSWQSQATFWAKKAGKSGKSMFTSGWSSICNTVSVINCVGKKKQEVEKD